jgi:ribosomal protein S17E
MKAFEKIKELVKMNGGITITPNGKKADLTTGYMVAVEKFNKNLKTIEDLTISDLNAAKKVAKKIGGYVGLYVREDNGSVDLDISFKKADLKEALKIGRAENQEAIFDNKNKRCIFCKK